MGHPLPSSSSIFLTRSHTTPMPCQVIPVLSLPCFPMVDIPLTSWTENLIQLQLFLTGITLELPPITISRSLDRRLSIPKFIRPLFTPEDRISTLLQHNNNHNKVNHRPVDPISSKPTGSQST